MLEVGKTYKTSDGRDVTIKEMCGDDPYAVDQFGYGPFRSMEFGLYHHDGKFASRDIPSLDIADVDTPKTWGEMTDAEKGALLLAWQRGETLQYWDCDAEEWRDTDIHPHEFDADAYRVKTTPDRVTISLGWEESLGVGNVFQDGDTHRITFDIIDGKPDCATVKMEAVE